MAKVAAVGEVQDASQEALARGFAGLVFKNWLPEAWQNATK